MPIPELYSTLSKPKPSLSPTGFSLIELMIVVVILAVLASVAIPGFQDQVARSQVMASLSELRSLTTAYEDLTLRGKTDFSLSDLGLESVGSEALTERCELSLRLPDETTGMGGISCIIQGSPRVHGFELHLNRNGQQGRWVCQSNLSDLFRPTSCVDGNAS